MRQLPLIWPRSILLHPDRRLIFLDLARVLLLFSDPLLGRYFNFLLQRLDNPNQSSPDYVFILWRPPSPLTLPPHDLSQRFALVAFRKEVREEVILTSSLPIASAILTPSWHLVPWLSAYLRQLTPRPKEPVNTGLRCKERSKGCEGYVKLVTHVA